MKAAKQAPKTKGRPTSSRVPDVATALHLRRIVVLIPATILGLALIGPRMHIVVNTFWTLLAICWAVTLLSVWVDVRRFCGTQEEFLDVQPLDYAPTADPVVEAVASGPLYDRDLDHQF